MAADGYIRIDTKIDTKGAKAGLNDLMGSLRGFATAVGVAFGVAAIAKFGASCVKAASDLAEVQNVVNVTFGQASGQIDAFAKSAATAFGLSELAAKRYTGTMGAMLKSMGFATNEAAAMSIEMAGLAGDMASFYNLSSDEAFEKIRSGLSGETEPLKQLGVNLSQANLEAFALAEGFGASYSSMSEQMKALVRYNYLLSATADAHGDFGRTSNSWANQVRILQLQFESLKATLGGAFIAVLTPVLQMINRILSALNGAAVVFAKFIAAVTGRSTEAVTATTAAADATAAAADAQSDLASNTAASGNAAEKAGKQAARGTQGFDELNKLSRGGSGSGGGGGSAGGGGFAAATTPIAAAEVVPEEGPLTSFFDRYAFEIGRVKESWGELALTVSGIMEQMRAQAAATDIGGELFRAAMNGAFMLIEAMNLVIGVVGDLLIAFNVPATIESGIHLIADAFQAIGNVVDAISPGVRAFVDIALVPIAEWAGTKVRDAFAFLSEQLTKVGDWYTAHKDDFTRLGETLGTAAAAVWKLIEPLADAAWDTAKALIDGVVDALLAFSDWCLDHQEIVLTATGIVGGFFGAWKVIELLSFVNEAGGVAAAFGRITDAIKKGTIAKLADIGETIALKTMLAVDVVKACATSVIAIGKQTGAWLLNKGAVIGGAIAQGAMTAATVAWNIICGIATGVTAAFGAAVAFLTSPIGLVVIAIGLLIAGIVLLVKNWDTVKEAASRVWDGVKAVWGAASGWFSEKVIEPIKAAFGGLKAKLDEVWDGIKAGVKGAINVVISAMNTLINGINKFKIKIPDWVKNVPGVGKYGGQSIGFNIPNIPKLAKGAVIPPRREFMAILGDQRSGTNIETPLDTMLQAFKQALAEMGGGGGAQVGIEFRGELAALARVLEPHITSAQNRSSRAAGMTLLQV